MQVIREMSSEGIAAKQPPVPLMPAKARSPPSNLFMPSKKLRYATAAAAKAPVNNFKMFDIENDLEPDKDSRRRAVSQLDCRISFWLFCGDLVYLCYNTMKLETRVDLGIKASSAHDQAS